MRRLVLQLGACVMAVTCLSAPLHAKESTCFGTTSKGRLQNGVALPSSGANFSSYSSVGGAMGRMHVHSRVAKVMTAALADLARERPDTVYVIGETGWPKGGSFRPHRTHQNGLSVDIMVPVKDAQGRSVPLPTPASKRWGYDLEFDAQGRLDDLQVDFEALAALLAALQAQGRQQGVGIGLVIVEPSYLPRMRATRHGTRMAALPFMKGKPWVRHDDHVHLDFVLPCQPL